MITKSDKLWWIELDTGMYSPLWTTIPQASKYSIDLVRYGCLQVYRRRRVCLLLSLIYPAVYLINKDLCELNVSRYIPGLCQKSDIFSEKRMEGIFIYVLEYMLTLVSLDKMQNISNSIRISSKSEGRAF